MVGGVWMKLMRGGGGGGWDVCVCGLFDGGNETWVVEALVTVCTLFHCWEGSCYLRVRIGCGDMVVSDTEFFKVN